MDNRKGERRAKGVLIKEKGRKKNWFGGEEFRNEARNRKGMLIKE
jgi:hypothetical protein